MKIKIRKILLFNSLIIGSILLLNDCKTDNQICPEGYSGESCQTKITPSQMIITGVKIKKFPQYKNGYSWDNIMNAEAPDIFITIVNDSSFSSTFTQIYNNANYNREYYFFKTNGIVLKNLSTKYTVKLFDYDTSDTNDLIGSFTFEYSKTNRFPASIDGNSNGIDYQINLQYKW